MNLLKSPTESLGWKSSWVWFALAVACFHVAYTSIQYPAAGLFIVGYALALIRLTNQPNVRRAFYFGLATGFFCYAPQLFFFFRIFNVLAVVLWLVLAFWVGLFTAVICGCVRRWGKASTVWLIPIVWTGVEYFRSELYYLRFSWMNVGYAFPFKGELIGIYGVGFLIFFLMVVPTRKLTLIELLSIISGITILSVLLLLALAETKSRHPFSKPLSLVGIQMEFPPPNIIPKALNNALAKNPDAQIFVLSEYTLTGPVPEPLKDWCRANSRFLVVGGEDPIRASNYYNTAFVIGTNGDIVFKQVKSVPIQFFRDGLPAPKQELWNSPWGKIGLCVCYDLSYTRVIDELVRQGAQIIIAPTMDVIEWGRHHHELHARVAPVRAAEYGIPIFRVCSSGISQAVTSSGQVIAQAPMPGNGDTIVAKLRLPARGSLPLDRWLAPICTGITALLTGVLLFLTWKEKYRLSKN